jgi:cyclopropane fatty-acyl-phospholipid synthase-like methyltransferase
LSEAEEKSRYDTHQNDPADSGYRRFLSRTFLPMQARLAPGSCGLDFGSGPGPTLSLMFQEAGHHVAIYDRFYAPDPSVFDTTYDFITATEVVEHLQHPLAELDRLWGCLKPGGTLGIMTKLVLDRERFATWHYKNDLTHICFFSQATFRWLARRWQANVEFVDQDVVFFSVASSC